MSSPHGEAATGSWVQRFVAAYKRDFLNGSRLDRQRRQGEWGGISADVGRKLGGKWTAHSHRPIRGLIAKSGLAPGDP